MYLDLDLMVDMCEVTWSDGLRWKENYRKRCIEFLVKPVGKPEKEIVVTEEEVFSWGPASSTALRAEIFRVVDSRFRDADIGDHFFSSDD